MYNEVKLNTQKTTNYQKSTTKTGSENCKQMRKLTILNLTWGEDT